MRYYLLYWFGDMTRIKMSLNVVQPEGLDRCLDIVNQMKAANRFRYFVVSEEEYQSYWKDKIT